MSLDAQLSAADRAEGLADTPDQRARAIHLALDATAATTVSPWWRRVPIVAGAAAAAFALVAAAVVSLYPRVGDTPPTLEARVPIGDGRVCAVGAWVVPQDAGNTRLDDRGLEFTAGSPLTGGTAVDGTTLGLMVSVAVGEGGGSTFESGVSDNVTEIVKGFDIRADFAAATTGPLLTVDEVGDVTERMLEDYLERIEAAGFAPDNNWSLAIGAECEAP